MSDHWENRVSRTQLARCTTAFADFRRSQKSQEDTSVFYDALTANGVTGEEAEEIIRLENENA